LVVTADIAGLPGMQDVEIYFDDIPPVIIIMPSTTGAYHYGDVLTFSIQVLKGGDGYPNNLVNGKIENVGVVVSESSGYTDSEGNVNLNFGSVEAIGDAVLIVSTEVEGIDKTAASNMLFQEAQFFLNQQQNHILNQIWNQ